MTPYDDLLARLAAHLQEPQQGQPQEPQAPPIEPFQAPDQTTGTRQEGSPQQPAGKPAQPCGTDTILMMAVFFAIMYFLLIRPANKQRKQHAAMLAALQKGDRVVTSGGIHGVVTNLNDKTVTMRVDNIKMTVDRSAIARVVRDEQPQTG